MSARVHVTVVVEHESEPDRSVTLRISVAAAVAPGRRALSYSKDFVYEIAAADSIAAMLDQKAWDSALTSGIFFGARKCGVHPGEMQVHVVKAEGVLTGKDVTALAVAASSAIQCAISGTSLAGTVTEGWRVVSVVRDAAVPEE